MAYVLRTMIVPASIVTQVQGLCALLAGEAGAGMFTAETSASGNKPATHYISSGLIEEYFAGLIVDPIALKNVSDAAGANLTQAAIDAILQAAIISGENPHVVLAANNLKLISEV